MRNDSEKVKKILKQARDAELWRMEIYPPKRNHDTRWVSWFNDQNEKRGSAYIPITPDSDIIIGLVKCPACGRENYAPNVRNGNCCWCTFNAVNSFELHRGAL